MEAVHAIQPLIPSLKSSRVFLTLNRPLPNHSSVITSVASVRQSYVPFVHPPHSRVVSQVLAVNNGGPVESVRDGVTGWLRPATARAFAEVYARLAQMATQQSDALRQARHTTERTQTHTTHHTASLWSTDGLSRKHIGATSLVATALARQMLRRRQEHFQPDCFRASFVPIAPSPPYS
eukprot:6203207-Pleurochrysis_carterae.AAC.3